MFPLNVGFIASYCRKIHGGAVDIKIFKYIHSLESAIERDPPDILALSNYPWCHNADMAMFRLLAAYRPEALRVMGGPNFPHDRASQIRFLSERSLIDAYVYLDGEIGFSNLVDLVRETGSLEETRRLLKLQAVPGTVQLSSDGRGLVAAPQPLRLQNLDEIPSPYLTGMMDSFFDGRLGPMISTNRGCPFRCTFCHDGVDTVNKVNSFSIERVKAELEYIASRVPSETHSLFVSDLNFGMYKRDVEICDALVDIRERFNYPHFIDVTTGKNAKTRVISAVKRLGNALRLSLSVQSMTEEVLTNIKRDNIRTADFMALQPAIRESKLPTNSEVILGLPGETLKSHLETIGNLLDARVDSVLTYSLMMINGAELNTPEQREKWGIKTKFRVLPRDFTRLRNGQKIIEVEEVAVETNSLSFEDYVDARKIALLLRWINHDGFHPVLKFLAERKLRVVDLLERVAARLSIPSDSHTEHAGRIRELFDEYVGDVVGELWDSEEAIHAFFDNDDNFQKLIDGVHGKNLLQTYVAAAFANAFSELVDITFSNIREMIFAAGTNKEVQECLRAIEEFCRGVTFNLLGADRFSTTPEMISEFDIRAWMADPADRPLSEFRLARPQLVKFTLSDEQFRVVEDVLDHFGRTPVGIGKAIIRLNQNTLWRRPEVVRYCN